MAQKGALSNAYKAMQRGQYDLALNALSRAEKHHQTTPEMAAEISFVRAQCYDRSGHRSEALEAYRYTKDGFRGTTYAYQAETRLKELDAQ